MGRRPTAGCSFAKDDPALLKIVGRHLNLNAVTHNGPHAITSHLSGRVCNDASIVIQMDTEAPIWKNFFNQAIENELFLLGQISGYLELDGRRPATLIGLDFVAEPLVLT